MVLVGGFAVVARYQPLVWGSSGDSSTTYVEGVRFSYATELINQGHIPITVNTIEPWTGNGLLRTTGVLVSGAEAPQAAGDISPRSYVPFRSFSLPPGQSRAILIQNVFQGCAENGPGTTTTYLSIGVKFSILGVPHTTLVDITPLPIHEPKTCSE